MNNFVVQSFSAVVVAAVSLNLSAEARVEELLKKMTTEEKIGQLVMGFTSKRDVDQETLAKFAEGKIGSVIWQVEDPALHDTYQRAALTSRLGIPVLFCADIIHGARTIFPIAPTLASAFEPEIFARVQSVAAREARMGGLDLVFAPMCDIAVDPRWGRVAETCGEDPYLSSLCVAAQVRGFQGDDPSRPDKVGSCLKHFCGYGASEGGRDYTTAELGDWVLRNRHLPTFKAGVEAGALAVMSSFNTIDGVPMVANRRLLTDVLRGEWGFRGFVVSDWGAVGEQIPWGFAENSSVAALRALAAGNDVDMCTETFQASLKGLLDEGKLSEAQLDEAVRRVLRVKFATGLFDRPLAPTKSMKECDDALAASMREAWPLARECVEKSAVMLENDGILPLKATKGRKVAVVGPLATELKEPKGCWVAWGNTDAPTSLGEAIREALGKDETVTICRGCDVTEGQKTVVKQDGSIAAVGDGALSREEKVFEDAIAAAAAADVVVIALGEYAGWTGENASRAELTLTGRQQELFDRVAALGKPVVSIVFAGRPLVTPEIWERSAAVLFVGQPGNAFAEGIANLLVGKRSPSGRLTMSIPSTVGAVPVNYNNFPGGRPRQGLYREFGGDWNNSSRDALFGRGKYVFGYGLTYGDFVYGKPEVSGDCVRTTVTNRGARAATETVQLYITQTACLEGVRPARELRGFRRVTLSPGESATVEFALDARTLGYVTRTGERRCDGGLYRVKIAPDAIRGEWTDYVCRTSGCVPEKE